MKQVTQRLRDGSISVIDVPIPVVLPHGVLVDVRSSLLSAGTERSKINTGRQSLIGKARARPDQVRQVMEKARRDGVRETIRTVRSRLDEPSALGYSAAGVVLAVGSRVRDLAPGDRVACGGADYAVHAEVDHVPSNLCVPLPDEVDFESGAFATVGSIAMHGVRQAAVHLGETVAVIGLGLVGQLTGQLLRAAGCRVVGIDLSPALLERSRSVGAADITFEPSQLSDDALPAEAQGCDAIVITAATPSSDPVRLAAQLARDRAKVVIVGDVGLEIPRAPYYDKELDLRLSRSYGPGRYDSEYEERGLDYPVGYVRWTERRNLQSFVELVASGRLDVKGLITGRFSVEDAEVAYRELISASASPLAMIISYEPSSLSAPIPKAAAHVVIDIWHSIDRADRRGQLRARHRRTRPAASGLPARRGVKRLWTLCSRGERAIRSRALALSRSDPGRSVDRCGGDRDPPRHPRRLCDRCAEEWQGGVRREAGLPHVGRAAGTSGSSRPRAAAAGGFQSALRTPCSNDARPYFGSGANRASVPGKCGPPAGWSLAQRPHRRRRATDRRGLSLR